MRSSGFFQEEAEHWHSWSAHVRGVVREWLILQLLFPHLQSGGGGRSSSWPREHMCWVGVVGGRTEMPKLVKAWPLPISDTLKALSSLYIQSLAAAGVDEKEEKLLDKKKFKKKKKSK